jgi:hypothetical protein
LAGQRQGQRRVQPIPSASSSSLQPQLHVCSSLVSTVPHHTPQAHLGSPHLACFGCIALPTLTTLPQPPRQCSATPFHTSIDTPVLCLGCITLCITRVMSFAHVHDTYDTRRTSPLSLWVDQQSSRCLSSVLPHMQQQRHNARSCCLQPSLSCGRQCRWRQRRQQHEHALHSGVPRCREAASSTVWRVLA